MAGLLRLTFVFFVFLVGCALPNTTVRRSPLEVRQLQSRTYDAPKAGVKKVMKAVVNVLQDEGFIIKNADKELGFITGVKEMDIEDRWDSLFAILLNEEQARYRKNSILECSANISEFGSEVRVRAIFQLKVMDNLGGTISIKQVDDPAFYQQFFAEVDKGIFLEKENL